MRTRLLPVLALVLGLVLAGCTAKSGSTTSSTTSVHTTSSGTTTAPPTNATAPIPLAANLTADKVNGTAPLNVTFAITATGYTNGTWRLAFGDGNQTTGTQLPANVTHAFLVGGNFTAHLAVTSGPTTVKVDLNLTILAGGPDYPKVFAFGASKAGCVGDAHGQNAAVPLNCINFQGGPTSPQVDGFWQALDARYLGKSFTSTIATSNPLPDSDCYFVAADETTITGDCTNGGEPAAGTVPANTAWMFIYPYAAPSTSIVVTFT